MHKDIDISILVPVYMGGESLPPLAAEISQQMSAMQMNYEIIFICDNSPDNSWSIIESIANINSHVQGLLLRTNVGQHNALIAGLNHCHGKVIITMDDDLQHSPKDIPLLIDKLNIGFDVVYTEFLNREHPLWKKFGSAINNLFATILIGKPRNLYLSPYRAFTREIRDELVRYRGPFVYIDGLILTATKNISSIEITHHRRHAGVSHYGIKKSFSLWMQMATGFSLAPLRITSAAGILSALIGFSAGIYLIAEILISKNTPPGWASIIVSVLIIGGIQMLAIGVLGEYLGRVLLTLNAKPQFVISKKIGNNTDPQ